MAGSSQSAGPTLSFEMRNPLGHHARICIRKQTIAHLKLHRRNRAKCKRMGAGDRFFVVDSGRFRSFGMRRVRPGRLHSTDFYARDRLH